MKKKLLVLGLLFFLVGCSNDNSKTSQSSSNETETSSSEVATEEDIFDSYVTKVDSITTDNYNEEDYGYYKYNDLLRAPAANLGLQVKIINYKILQVFENGKYTTLLGSMPNNDVYIGLIETERLETKLLADDVLYFNSQYLSNYKYMTTANVEKEVPLLYINGYSLSEQ